MNYAEICKKNPQAFKHSEFVLNKETGRATVPKVATYKIKLPAGDICASFFRKYHLRKQNV